LRPAFGLNLNHQVTFCASDWLAVGRGGQRKGSVYICTYTLQTEDTIHNWPKVRARNIFTTTAKGKKSQKTFLVVEEDSPTRQKSPSITGKWPFNSVVDEMLENAEKTNGYRWNVLEYWEFFLWNVRPKKIFFYETLGRESNNKVEAVEIGFVINFLLSF
jgi:hypothetical protein